MADIPLPPVETDEIQFSLYNIQQYIGNRCGLTQASDITNYSDSILNYFLQAMTTVLSNGEFSAVEVPELTEEFTEAVSWSNGKANIPISSLDDVLHVDRIAFSDTASSAHIFKKITPVQLEIAKMNQFLLPAMYEGLYAIDADKIKILVNPNETETSVLIIGIKTPVINTSDIGDWVSDKGYGKAFLMRSIELASSLLRRELGLEV
jgi:hypothetical protein